MFFEGDEVQAVAALRVVAPGLPGRQEIQAGAKAGFDDDEAFASAPAGSRTPFLQQPVATEKDMTSLPQAAISGMVDIAVIHRPGRTIGSPGEGGGGEGGALIQGLGGVVLIRKKFDYFICQI